MVGDWCTEILLDILQLILAGLIDIVKTRELEFTKLIDDILASFDMCVTLLNSCSNPASQNNSQASSSHQNSEQTALVERASQCLILML